MKIPNHTVVSLAALVIASGVSGIAKGDDKKARAEITAIYHTLDIGLAHKSTKPLIAILTPDFTVIEGKSTINRDRAIKLVSQEFNSTLTINPTPTIITSFKTQGNKIIVATKNSATFVEVDGQHKKHTIVDAGTTLDTWVKTSKGWNMKTSVIKTEKATVDGKVIPGAAPG